MVLILYVILAGGMPMPHRREMVCLAVIIKITSC